MLSNTPEEIFFDPPIYESQFAYAAQFPDVPFWIELAQTFGPKVLELGCGTGRITIPAFECGIDIDGLDFSESMLKVARDRAKAKSLAINFLLGDLRTLLHSLPLNPEPEHSTFVLQPTKETVRLATTRSYHADTQLFAVKFCYTFADGLTREATVVLRLYFPGEFQALLYYNGFVVSRTYGD